MASLNLSMSDELRAFVDARTVSGGFSTPTEYVRHLIREDREREAERRLEAVLLGDVATDGPVALTDEWWDARRRALTRKLPKAAKPAKARARRGR